MALSIQAFLEPISSTFSYVIADTENKKCAVIDSVLDMRLILRELRHRMQMKLLNIFKIINIILNGF